MLKQVKFSKFSKVTAKPKVMEKVMEFEELKKVRTLFHETLIRHSCDY